MEDAVSKLEPWTICPKNISPISFLQSHYIKRWHHDHDEMEVLILEVSLILISATKNQLSSPHVSFFFSATEHHWHPIGVRHAALAFRRSGDHGSKGCHGGSTRDPWGDETRGWTGTDNTSHLFCPVLSSSGVEISEMNDEFRMELELSQGWSCTNWVWLKCWGGCLVGNELSSQCWICLCRKCHRLAPSELKRLGKLR